MARVRVRGELVRRFIIENLEAHPRDISRHAAKQFKITRQAVHEHLRRMFHDGTILREGRTQNCTYKLAPVTIWRKIYAFTPELSEEQVWVQDVLPQLGSIPDNVARIWGYGFTEMFNNARDHSQGSSAIVLMQKTAASVRIQIHDNGIGIFRKIQAALRLADPRHAVLELAKGKFTTAPEAHSGEGIFFSSRMFDRFVILSHEVHFSHEWDSEDWIQETESPGEGTSVFMTLSNHTARTTKKVMDQFSDQDNYAFTTTIVPVRLAKYGGDHLVSRSQAKRMLARIDRFKIVIFDFASVTEIGQAFADEVFRVFPALYPGVTIRSIHVNSAVKRMIVRAESGVLPLVALPLNPTAAPTDSEESPPAVRDPKQLPLRFHDPGDNPATRADPDKDSAGGT